jgi:hypothetical protein
MKHENAYFSLQKTGFARGQTCQAMLNKLDFSVKNVTKKDVGKIMLF